MPRLACVFVLKGRAEPGFLVVLATKCSSWVGINVGTSGRSKCGSIGLEKHRSVVMANGMAERSGWVLLYFFKLILCFGIKLSVILEDCFIMLIDSEPFGNLGS